MKKPIEDYLVPHDGNNYKPRIFAVSSVLALVFIIVIIFATSVVETTHLRNDNSFLAAVLPGVLATLTNSDRVEYNLSPLTYSTTLEKAAQLKANDMAAKSYFAHTSPEGLTPWTWFGRAGYSYEYAGENLAVNFSESEDVVNAWMKSEGHRANILGQNYTEIGIATAEGMYKDKDVVFVVQLFGKPLVATQNPVSEVASVREVEPTIDNSENEVRPTSEDSEEVIPVSEKENDPTIPIESEAPQVANVEEPVLGAENENTYIDNSQLAEATSDFDENIYSEPDTPETLGEETIPREEAPSWFLEWFYHHPTRIMQVIYIFIICLIFFSLGFMTYRGVHHEHPRAVFVSIALIMLMVVLMFLARGYMFNLFTLSI